MSDGISRLVVAACSATLVFAPLTGRAAEPLVDSAQPHPERGRRLLISGGVLGGVGLIATTVGFGIFGGIHMGNPGPGLSIEAPDPSQARGMLSAANTSMVVGAIGASLLLTGVLLAGLGGSSVRKARAARFARVVGPTGLTFRF